MSESETLSIHSPRPAEQPRAAFAQFQEYLVEQFQGGRRFVDDLPREVIADEAELSKMATEATAAPAGGEAPSGTDED